MLFRIQHELAKKVLQALSLKCQLCAWWTVQLGGEGARAFKALREQSALLSLPLQVLNPATQAEVTKHDARAGRISGLQGLRLSASSAVTTRFTVNVREAVYEAPKLSDILEKKPTITQRHADTRWLSRRPSAPARGHGTSRDPRALPLSSSWPPGLYKALQSGAAIPCEPFQACLAVPVTLCIYRGTACPPRTGLQTTSASEWRKMGLLRSSLAIRQRVLVASLGRATCENCSRRSRKLQHHRRSCAGSTRQLSAT